MLNGLSLEPPNAACNGPGYILQAKPMVHWAPHKGQCMKQPRGPVRCHSWLGAPLLPRDNGEAHYKMINDPAPSDDDNP